MTVLETSLVCRGCGGSLDLSSLIPAVMTCACHGRGAPVSERVQAHGGFCGDACRNLAARRRVARHRRCPACQKDFDNGHIDPKTGQAGPGRPSVYCSDACRSATERARDTAMKELAKSTVEYRTRDEYVDAIQRAFDLLEFWCGRGPTKPTEPAPPPARDALRERLETLRERLQQVDQAIWANEQRDLKAHRQKVWADAKSRQREADKAWRDDLLKKKNRDALTGS